MSMLQSLCALLLIVVSKSITIENINCPYFGPAAPPGSPFVNGERVNLVDAQNNDGAACLDGSVPSMYWRAGFGDGVNKFHVYFEGGGWCGGVNAQLSPCQDTCVHRSGTDLGSSKAYPASANFDSGYMSTNANVNPLTYNWNTVFVKYCDGASFSGHNDTTETSGAVTLHWRGWRILNGVYKLLQSKYNFDRATDVLMSGCSAGGLTTWLHSDYVYDTYVKPLGANFMSMPDSGFFLEYEGTGKFITAMQWLFAYQNTSSALNAECMQSHSNTNDGYKCMFAQETAPFVRVKTFPLQSRFDSWQTGCELQSSDASQINNYGSQLTTQFENMYINGGQYAPNHAAFFDSCSHHCGAWNGFKIDGMTASNAQLQVYYGNNTHNKFWFQQETYPCTSCCH